MSLHRRLGTRVVAGIMGLALLLIPLASCNGPGQTTTPTPTATPLQFVTLDLGIPPNALNSPVVGQVPDDSPLHVVVTFKTNQALLAQLQKKKVKVGQSVDLQQQANQIGISDKEYAKIKSYFGVQDATLKLGKLHTNLTIDAKARTFATLLQTHFVYHQYNGRKFFAPATAPKLPKFIADNVVAVAGLDNYSLPPQRSSSTLQPLPSMNGDAAKTRPQANCSPDPRLYGPGDVGHAYGYDQLWKQGWIGQNMRVNLVEFAAYDPTDIQNYFDCVRFQGKLIPVTVDNRPPTQTSSEVALDIDMIAGLAPAANIVVYQTDISGISSWNDYWTLYSDELTQIINDNTKGTNGGVLSISWGSPEDVMTTSIVKTIDSELQVLTASEHMTIFSASGDCGAFGDRAYGQLAVDYPASDPWSVAVGGTLLATDRQGNRVVEAVWSDGSNRSKCNNRWGSGGGNSRVFARPRWQSAAGVNNHYSDGARQVPDVSALAFGEAIYYGGQWRLSGGTSAAAPIWATGFALVNEGLIQKTGYFYYGPETFYGVADNSGSLRPYYDVTRGNNLYYPATPGWDYASGLGTPNLPAFFIILYKSLK